MKSRSFIAIVALALAPLTGFCQDVHQLVNQEDVGRIIKTLSADDMQGRGTFTPGIDKAATFIEGEFKKAGLSPLAGAKGFRQNFSMVRTTPVSSKVVINGTEVAASNVAIGASQSFNWATADGVEVVRISAGKDFITEYRAIMNSDKKLLILVDTSFSKIFTRVAARYKDGGTSFKAAASDGALVFVMGTFGDVKSLTVNYESKATEQPLFNVVGIIPGKTKPNEYVVFSGHYDHLGILSGKRVMEGDSIANGADDDASGTTAVISLAKYYKKLNNNARTLVFVAFTAEEIGGFGSQYFSKQMNPDQVVAMFNIEMIGKEAKFGANTAFITGYERSDFGTILQKNLTGTAFTFHPDPYPEQNLFYRSDNATLAALGVPAHTISTDQIPTDKLYHTVKDEFSSLDVANITATIRAIALSSRSIVAGTDTPSRIPKLAK
ncbi:M20/M25/M40 family metallo-hydrolase [Inquilinus sp. KBS0705]|nr:M20/M25/M40 family metallo-hydrolase [Inquilinus sp. KBS0705]